MAIQIPESEIEFTYARSSGPGGQNVNKVNSKAVLRWNLLKSPSISEEVRQRFLSSFGTKVNKDGELLLSSDTYRDQFRNREECLTRLHEMLSAVQYPPKKRKKSKPTRSSVLKRREGKKILSDKKQSRRRVF